MASEIDPANVVDEPVTAAPSVHTDTLDSVTALARFEFEPLRGNEGTKIMMVEWQDDNKTRHKIGSWQVSWPGKKTSFAADDNPSDSTNRLYFLLPPGAVVPPTITITYTPPRDQQALADGTSDNDGSLHKSVRPLPAIFTPELGATAKASGRKGVLHTIWAKKRLQVLAKEIQVESELNLEGIALEMATAEKQWIEQNFGINTTTTNKAKQQSGAGLKIDMDNVNSGAAARAPLSPGLQSPGTPGGRRLTDKLKGLSLMTSKEKDSPAANVNTPTHDLNPLSPEVGDMAVSSFSTFKGDRPTPSLNAITSTSTTTNNATSIPPPQPQQQTRRIVPISPPSTVSDEQAQAASASLAGIARSSNFNSFSNTNSNSDTNVNGDATSTSTSKAADKEGENESDDLFAVAMSPRSPDAPLSPFSIPREQDSGGAFSRIKGVKMGS